MLDQRSKIKDQNQTKNSKTELKYRAFYLSINIIKFLEGLAYKQSIIISDQLIRCIASVRANIVEAKSSFSKKEFLEEINFPHKGTRFFPIKGLSFSKCRKPSQLSTQSGFMAFSLILLLSAVVLVIVTTVSLVSIGEMQSSMGLYNGEYSIDLTEGCAEDALIKINANSKYGGGISNYPDGSSCQVIVISGDPNWNITAAATPSASSNNKYQRKIQVIFNRSSSGITMTSWREI